MPVRPVVGRLFRFSKPLVGLRVKSLGASLWMPTRWLSGLQRQSWSFPWSLLTLVRPLPVLQVQWCRNRP